MPSFGNNSIMRLHDWILFIQGWKRRTGCDQSATVEQWAVWSGDWKLHQRSTKDKRITQKERLFDGSQVQTKGVHPSWHHNTHVSIYPLIMLTRVKKTDSVVPKTQLCYAKFYWQITLSQCKLFRGLYKKRKEEKQNNASYYDVGSTKSV